MHGDFSRGHRPDRKRGKAYRRVLLQQGRTLLDSDFNALSDANEHLLRELARDVGLGDGSPDGGFRITVGPLLARFDTLQDVVPDGTDFVARLDLRHRYEERLPSLLLDARRGAGKVTLRLRRRLLASEYPKLRIWARLPGALRVGIGGGAEQPFPGNLSAERFQAYELPVPAGVTDFDSLTLRFETAGPDNEAWIGLIEGIPADTKAGPFWVSRGRYRVDGLAVELREDAPYPEVSFPRAKGFRPRLLEVGVHVAYLEVWERHITHVEDPGLLEPALGGTVDTCTRVETVGQVKLAKFDKDENVELAGPESFHTAFTWPNEPARTLRVQPRRVALDPGTVGSALYTGYTGAENRLYRFEIHDGGGLGVATLKWSRNNGASLFRVLRVMDANTTLALPTTSDVRNGDLIEVLTETVELGDGNDGQVFQDTAAVRFSPPTRTVGRLYYVREKGLTGSERLIELRDVTTRLPVPLDTAIAAQPGMKIRRWDGFLQTSKAGATLEIEDGLDVGLTGGPFRAGDYWQYEARRGQEGTTTPWEPPMNGSERLFVPLALVRLRTSGGPVQIDAWLDPDPSSGKKLWADNVLYDGTPVPTSAGTVQEALDELYARYEGEHCDARLSPGLHGADDGERLSLLIQQKLPTGGVVCLSEGLFRLKSRVEILGKHVELRGQPGTFLLHEVPGASALHVGAGGRLTFTGLTLVAGGSTKVGREALVSFTPDCEGLSARDCRFFHLREDAAGIGLLSEAPELPAKESADLRGWSQPLASGGPELRLDGCTLVAGWGVSAGNLEGLSLHDTTVLCVEGGVVTWDLGELELQGASLNTGLDDEMLKDWAGRPVEQLAAAVAAWREQNPVKTGRVNSTALYAARVGSGTVRESTFVADMGLWVGAGAHLRLERNHYFTSDTAVRVDHATDTVLETEDVAAQNLGIHVPAVATGLSLSACHVQAPRAVVLGGAYDAAQPLTEVLLQDLRVGGNQLRGEQVGLQLGPWEVGSLASLGMTAHNLDIRENIIRVLTVEGRGLSGVLPAQGGAPFVLRVAHNQIEAGQTAVWLKGGGVEVAHNKLDAQGQDTLVETPPTGVLTLVEAAGSLVEGNAVHLGKVGTGLCVRSSQDVRVRSNVVRCPEPGRPLWVLDSQRVEVGDNELEAGGCLVSAVQTLTVRGNRLAGLLSIQGSSNGVVSQNRLNRPTEASLAIDKARERWQLHENIAMGGIQLLPDIKGVTPPAVEEELEFQAQVQGNWASNLQVGYLHPDDSALLSVRDLPIAKPHPGSTVQVVANRAEGRLVVNHYGRFLITNNAIRELVCGVNALDRIEALNLSRPQGTGGQPPGGGGPPPGGGQTPGGTGVEEGLGRTLTPLPSGLLLVAGGADASGVCLKTAYLYNPFQDTWQQVGMMTTARAYHTATLLPSGLVMVVGGTDGAQTLASAELFDPNTREWSPILTGALGVARQRATAVLLGTGQVLVTGGVNKSGVLASTELFDSVKKTWTLLPQQMASPRTLHTATMLPTGQVLVSGGTNGTHFLATAEVYEPGARQWTLVGAMATARGRATATLLGTGAVLVSGGWNGQGPLSSAELYVPSGGTWTLVGTMAHSRQEHTATLLLSGRVLVMGGRGGGGLAQSTVELYDPRTRTWSLVTPMASARYGHLAVLLSSGMVLVASGVNGTTPLSSVELYGAAAGDLSWNYTQNLNWAHSDHAAVAITTTPSGGGSVQKVLVFGGASFVGSYEWLEILDLSSNSLSAVTIGYNQPTTYSLGDGCTATVLNTGKVFVVSARISLIYDPVSQTVAQTTINRYTVSHGYNHTATLLRDGKVLVAGGQSLGTGINALSAVELFDPGPKDSTTVARLSVGRANATATLLPSATTTTPDKVLVTGGFDETTVLASAELYDTASKTWSPAPRMTIPRALHTATRFESGPLAGKVLVVGGRDASGVPDASAELYDPVHGSWRLTGAMTFKRERHTATLLPSGLVLVLGGRDENQSALDSVEVYDPATERWSMSMPSLRTARHGHSATLLASGAVLVSGGLNGGTRLSVMELYSPVPRRWRYLSLPAGQSFHLSESTNTGEIVGNPSVTLLADGSVLCAGGLDKAQSLPGNLSQSQARSSVVTFNPATQTWKSAEMGPLITARGGHTATLLPSGKVLMVGGAVLTETNKGVFPTEKVEVYDPVARKSVSVQGFSLGTARWAHTATLLASGKVLVVGGRTRHYYDRFSDVFLDNVDVYDPVTRSWSSVGTLPFALAHHAAVLLADGKVLVTGGIGARLGTGSKTALLFDPNKPYDPRNPSAAWSATLAPMKGTHYRHTATRFESGPLAGKVLVAGGGASPPELYDPNATDPTKVWTFTGAMATNRSDHFAHLLPDGKVLVVGGTADLSEVYNPASGTWSTMGSVGLGFSGRGSALLPSGGVFALWEGFAAAYLPLVGTWTSTNSPSMTHEQPVAALLGQGQVLLVGQNKAELYDPVTERWEEAGSMKTNLPPDSITPLKDGGVLVIKRGAAELYDPANPQAPWSTVDAGMVNKVRRGHTATLLPSGGVLVVGGSSPNNNGIEDFTYTVELYQPGQGWSSKKSMTGVLSNPPSNHSATFLPDVGLEGSVLVLGQWGVAGLYDVAGDSWKAISTLPVLGGRHTVTRFESGPLAGKLLVVGSFSNAELKAVIFDPKATVEPWRSTKHSPAYKHSHHSATLLPSGKVLIVGAKIESTLPAVVDTAQAEVFDPVTETWALGGRMGTPRFDHTATLLPSGKVLVLEGLTPVMREGTTMGTLQPVLVSVNTAELYDELGTQDTWHPGASLPG